jgi:hypothetical protein
MFSFFSRTPSKAAFVKLVRAEMDRAGVQGTWEYDEQEFSLRMDDALLFLGNSYASYCEADKQLRPRIVENIVSAILPLQDAPIEREQALGMAVAVIRELALFEFTSLLWQMDGIERPVEMAAEPVSDWLGRTVVLDSPGSMRMVTQKDLEHWDISFDELFAVGLEKLRASTPAQFTEVNGILLGTWKDDYDSSRILLPGLFQELHLEGDPVMVTPNRLTLMVTGSNNHAGVIRLLQVAEEITQEQARGMNPAPLTYRDGHLQDFRVERDSPLYNPVERASKIAALVYYTGQKEELEKLHQKTGKDIFVATYNLSQGEDGSYNSYSVWSQGVPTLLPKADVVFFHHPEAKLSVSAEWDDVMRVAGDLMLDTGMFPARWYVSRFPTEEQFTAMGAKAL